MKILGYEMRPMHALYAGMLTLNACCPFGFGGSNDEFREWNYPFEDKDTLQRYVARQKEMELNGRLKHPGKWPAVLLRCDTGDGNRSDKLSIEDLAWLDELEIRRNNEVFDWPEGFPSEKSE
ncbi:hypothetical protein GF343_03410 [Candidatus Woesearchaeota archaeon]|nr:hypothetical protein [Candidatus Woesearchaeota archaeon]